MRFEFSAGGIVFRKRGRAVEVLVAQHAKHHGWVFPKGLIGDTKKGEQKQETAVREVKEETGVWAKIVKELSPVTYWYQWEGEKIKKTVYYFLMEYVSGDTKNRDLEMENVEWLPMDAVGERLTYKSDLEVWQEAKNVLESS